MRRNAAMGADPLNLAWDTERASRIASIPVPYSKYGRSITHLSYSSTFIFSSYFGL